MKIRFNLIAFALLLAIATTSVKAASVETDATENPAMMTDVQKQQRLEEIKERIEAIKTMDKSQLTKEDRVELKHELKDMRHEIGVYRSVNLFLKLVLLIALIIILIILLH